MEVERELLDILQPQLLTPATLDRLLKAVNAKLRAQAAASRPCVAGVRKALANGCHFPFLKSWSEEVLGSYDRKGTLAQLAVRGNGPIAKRVIRAIVRRLPMGCAVSVTRPSP